MVVVGEGGGGGRWYRTTVEAHIMGHADGEGL